MPSAFGKPTREESGDEISSPRWKVWADVELKGMEGNL